MIEKPIDKSIFRFKRFSLSNQKSAMKIGTDGVLLGAWADVSCVKKVWDVGCGTGLIALMLAQRADDAHITGFEINLDAADEARNNFNDSLWCDRVRVVHGDFLQNYRKMPVPDLIVSNPPFFTNALRANGVARNGARHDDSLSYSDLIRVASEVLSPEGKLCMVSPVERRGDIEWGCCLYKLNVQRVTEVVTVPGKRAKRLLWQVGRAALPTIVDELYIRNDIGGYTDEYKALTSDFYLNF